LVSLVIGPCLRFSLDGGCQRVNGDDDRNDTIVTSIVLSQRWIVKSAGFAVDNHDPRLGLTTDMATVTGEVIASLLIDPSGRVRDGGTSRSLSSAEDRRRFLSLRKWADCILVGSNTAAAENYRTTSLPVIIYSRREREIEDWKAEISRLKSTFGSHILVEAGPTLLTQLIDQGLIDSLYLTRTRRISKDVTSPIFDPSLHLQAGSMKLMESSRGEEDLFEVYERVD
jgi:riboflavin biosynthesis pyrimidine reductase